MSFIESAFAKSIGDDAWPTKQAAILLLYSIAKEDRRPELHGFVKSALTPLFECCRSPIPRLRETSLFVLAMIILSFKKLFTEDFWIPPNDFIRNILDMLVVDVSTHPTVLLRYLLIIANLVKVWNDAAVQFQFLLWQFSEEIVDILKQIKSRPITSNEDVALFQLTSNSLGLVIEYGSCS
jgi:hypothetical protein